METGIRTLTFNDLNTLTTVKQEQYGALGATADGRRFRYVGFGGTTTVAPGLLLTAAPVVANYQGLAVTAVNTGGQTAANLLAGSTTLVVTNGATAIVADQFAEGYLEVLQTSGANNGPVVYRVRGNTAAANAATFTVFLESREPLRNATTLVAGTDTVNLSQSDYSNVITSATANVPVGLTVVQVVNTASVSNWGWVQIGGHALVQEDATAVTVGGGIAQSTTTAGKVTASTASVNPVIGVAKVASAGTTTIPANLNLT